MNYVIAIVCILFGIAGFDSLPWWFSALLILVGIGMFANPKGTKGAKRKAVRRDAADDEDDVYHDDPPPEKLPPDTGEYEFPEPYLDSDEGLHDVPAAPVAPSGRFKYRVPCAPLTPDLVKNFRWRLLVWMHYADGEGEQSQRRVALIRTDSHYAYGWCLEADGWRQFAWHRIRRLVALQTGEILDPRGAEIHRFVEEAYLGPAGVAVRPHSAEVQVLIYMARRDGAMRAPERKLILDYLNAIDPACKALPDEDLDGEIKKLADFSQQEMRAALAELTERSPRWRAAFCQLCVKIAQSDNRLHDAERNALADIHRRLGVPVPAAYVGNRRPGQAQ